MNIDCNNCANLNMTEYEQRKLKDNRKRHICNFYKRQVKHHIVNGMNHKFKLYPCEECKNENYIRFVQK